MPSGPNLSHISPRRRRWARHRWGGTGVAKQMTRGCDWAHLWSIGALGEAGGAAGERRWRSSDGATAVAQSPTRWGANLVVGEFGKNLTPSKRRFCRDSRNNFSGDVRKWHSRLWLLRMNLLSISGWTESAKDWNLEPVKPWNCESAKDWNHEPAKLRNRQSAKFGNLMRSKFGGYDVWRSSHMEDSEISKKQVKDVASKVWVKRVN
jgi:hypothetical protein